MRPLNAEGAESAEASGYEAQLQEIQRRIEADYRANLAALVRLRQVLKEDLRDGVEKLRQIGNDATHRQRIVACLRNGHLTTRQISQLSGVPENSARMVLCTETTLFKKSKEPGSRTQRSLIEPPRPEHDAPGAPPPVPSAPSAPSALNSGASS